MKITDHIRVKRPHRQPQLAAAAFQDVDGLTVSGGQGILRVSLTLRSLSHPPRAPKITHWLLPLDQPEMARRAAELDGKVLWLCSHPPANIGGGLALDFGGAWIDDETAILQIGQAEYYSLEDTDDKVTALAQIVALRWAGYKAPAIKNFLRSPLSHPNCNARTSRNFRNSKANRRILKRNERIEP